MEVFVKRENWDGGIWMKLPASEEQAEQLQEELAGYHPSMNGIIMEGWYPASSRRNWLGTILP